MAQLFLSLRTEGGWNAALVREILWKEDADLVLSIPTSSRCRDDILCWHYTQDGEYTIKSGYTIGLDMEWPAASSSSLGSGFDWSRIWTLKLPQKIKIFMWRAYHYWLPTFVSLARRKMPVDVCADMLSKRELELQCIVFWRSLFLRNQAVHGNGEQDLEKVVDWSRHYHKEFYDAAVVVTDVRRLGNPIHVHWQAPSDGVYKLNTDASLDTRRQKVGLGMVIRNHLGSSDGHK
ncbi:hypothetical protein EZV62_022013 [Acer yangbiense]|uniref:Uncharacterized protein n=1 Tax=Acer yangbiense TaxID=1000413 RepID=A0A5C7H789_9ROSI|nr:hypothetical protein EZV62_022013 [Acer yangbiense]